MKPHEIEQIEFSLLLEAIYRRYGYDFRSYARASIERRIRHFMCGRKEKRISELISEVIYDEGVFSELARCFSISVTEMFRDPYVYRALRDKVVPFLKTYPFVKVWHAGCATGEEVYSFAILLKEEGIYGRTSIFATDFNDRSLEQARKGIYSAERMREFSQNYQEAGGRGSFSEFYHANYGSVLFNEKLRERITFANHNLAGDAGFGEMHLIFCRNVLIYFNTELQNRVLKLFDESLVRGGFLCLGTKETLEFTEVADHYEVVDRESRIYRKKIQ